MVSLPASTPYYVIALEIVAEISPLWMTSVLDLFMNIRIPDPVCRSVGRTILSPWCVHRSEDLCVSPGVRQEGRVS